MMSLARPHINHIRLKEVIHRGWGWENHTWFCLVLHVFLISLHSGFSLGALRSLFLGADSPFYQAAQMEALSMDAMVDFSEVMPRYQELVSPDLGAMVGYPMVGGVTLGGGWGWVSFLFS